MTPITRPLSNRLLEVYLHKKLGCAQVTETVDSTDPGNPYSPVKLTVKWADGDWKSYEMLGGSWTMLTVPDIIRLLARSDDGRANKETTT